MQKTIEKPKLREPAQVNSLKELCNLRKIWDCMHAGRLEEARSLLFRKSAFTENSDYIYALEFLLYLTNAQVDKQKLAPQQSQRNSQRTQIKKPDETSLKILDDKEIVPIYFSIMKLLKEGKTIQAVDVFSGINNKYVQAKICCSLFACRSGIPIAIKNPKVSDEGNIPNLCKGYPVKADHIIKSFLRALYKK
jgi:hypothetical protein